MRRRRRRAGAVQRTSSRPGTRRSAASTSIVTTGTASGKTLAFNLPVLDALARDPHARALYLYPTKALAQDQFQTLAGYGARRAEAGRVRRRHADRASPAHPWLGERDPDQPRHDPRRRPAEPRPLGRRAGEPALRRRRRGARLPRRLRLARRERPAPPAADRAAATAPSRSSFSRRRRSRTPASSARRCSASRSPSSSDDAPPRAERTIVLWNPPLLDAELGLRGSALAEAARLQALFVERGLRTLTFAKSRKAAELVHRFTAERLGDDTQPLAVPRRLHRGPAARDRAPPEGR